MAGRYRLNQLVQWHAVGAEDRGPDILGSPELIYRKKCFQINYVRPSCEEIANSSDVY